MLHTDNMDFASTHLTSHTQRPQIQQTQTDRPRRIKKYILTPSFTQSQQLHILNYYLND